MGLGPRDISPMPMYKWMIPSLLPKNSKYCYVAGATRASCEEWQKTDLAKNIERSSILLVPMYKPGNPTTNGHLQHWPVWGIHYPLFCLLSSVWVRIQQPCCHWSCSYWYMHGGSSHVKTASWNTLYQGETGDGLCCSLISDGMADWTVEMHCMTGYDAISGFLW